MRSKLFGIPCLLAILAGGEAPGGELLIDDFDDGDLDSPLGLPWVVLGDDLMGGTSAASPRVEAAGGSRILILDGGLGAPAGPPAGLPVAFVGVWTAVGDDGLGRDLSAYRGLRLRGRATTGAVQVGLRRAGVNANYVAPLELGSEWTEVEVPFSALEPVGGGGAAPQWSAADVAWVGVSSSGGEAGPVRVEIDRLAFYGGPDARRPPASAAASGSPTVRSPLVDAGGLAALRWILAAEDAAGDGLRSGLPDARSLSWAPGPEGRIWFRVTLAEAPPERWMGVNVALDGDEDRDNGMAWWGTNAFRFDLLVTAYLTRVEGGWLGMLGVANAEDVARGVMSGVTGDVVAAIDRDGRALLVGVPREALPTGGPIRLIATVGSSMVNNDDLPNDGAAVVDFSAVGEAAAAGARRGL